MLILLHVFANSLTCGSLDRGSHFFGIPFSLTVKQSETFGLLVNSCLNLIEKLDGGFFVIVVIAKGLLEKSEACLGDLVGEQLVKPAHNLLDLLVLR